MKWRRRGKTPVPPLTRGGAGTSPGAGAAGSQSPAHGRTPAASPGTGSPLRSRPWMTAEFYPEGHVIVRDHVQRKKFKFTFPSGDDIAAEIIRDLRDG